MKTLLTLLAALFLIILTFSNGVLAQNKAAEYAWQEKRNKDGIKIFSSRIDSSPYRAVRGTMQIKASMVSLVALVEDMAKCSAWVYRCREARVINRVSDTESYTYIYNDLPFPAKDRDVYAHTRWTVLPEQNRVTMTSIAKPNGPQKTKALRIESAVTQWHFTTQQDGTVLVENFAHVDPDGVTPAWFANSMLVSSAYKTLRGMREVLSSGAYADAEVEFLDSNIP